MGYHVISETKVDDGIDIVIETDGGEIEIYHISYLKMNDITIG